MNKPAYRCIFFLIFACCTSRHGQDDTEQPRADISAKNQEVVKLQGPQTITRTIIKDSQGHIWVAAYDGIFRYDGETFTNMTNQVSSARFFSVLEDKKGNFWFSSVGSGVFYYDGKTFRNFTTDDGLANNRVTEICEDKSGHVWFSTEGGVSCYDGQTFRNFTTKDGLPNNDVGPIIEDKAGKLWIGTRGDACIYDGKTFTVLTHQGKPFQNVRSIIEDAQGDIWLGGNDGLWRYDGSTFTHFAQQYVGYVYEDPHGNIWTSTNSDRTKSAQTGLYNNSLQKGWALSRYDKKALANAAPLPEIIKTNEGMIFGILEADDGNIWFGTLNGVYRYAS